MRRFLARLTVTGLALTGLAGASLAMEPTMPRNKEAFDKLDADHDGKLTLDEYKPRALRRAMRVDKDKNGEISTAEIEADLQKALEQRRNKLLRDMDADRNGAISKAEVDAFIAALMKSADADGDGSVSFDEARGSRTANPRKGGKDGGDGSEGGN